SEKTTDIFILQATPKVLDFQRPQVLHSLLMQGTTICLLFHSVPWHLTIPLPTQGRTPFLFAREPRFHFWMDPHQPAAPDNILSNINLQFPEVVSSIFLVQHQKIIRS